MLSALVPFFSLQAIETRLGLDKLSDSVRRYTVALVGFVFAVAVSAILLRFFGTKPAILYSLLFDLVTIGAAWLGYGPGFVVCTMTTFLAPRILLPHRLQTPVDPGKFALVIFICFLISRMSAVKRRTEASLRKAAEDLERRVEERTHELQRSEELLRHQADLLDLAQDAILSTDPTGAIRYWNHGAERMYGWTAADASGKDAAGLTHSLFPASLEAIRAKLERENYWQGELRQTRRDGSQLTVMSHWSLRRDAAGQPSTILQINSDVTDRRRVEDRLRHTQKMESIGLLAGGVAHDFNNLLTVINGYAEMLAADLPPHSSTREGLREIRAAGERAAGLTHQLLAFSRKQLLQPTVVNLNHVVSDIQKMLRRLIGEDIAIVTKLAPGIGNVVADAGQLHQILVNLAVNARDAMRGGGTLIFETKEVTFDESFKSTHPEVQIGQSIMLAVTDTGTGMTPQVQEHLFEPFFTTKPKGAGTGLGLATVYGMVKQNNGWIWVYSELGNGSTFKIHFPRVDVPLPEVSLAPRVDPLGDETILVVEDQVEVRNLTVAALRRFGYTILDAGSGREALALSDSFSGNIDLLLTDVVMPAMSGRELADEMAVRRPGIKTLFVSGYTETAILHRGVLKGDPAYLQKPFTPELLGEKLREVLGPKGAAPVIMIVDDEPGVRRVLSDFLRSARYTVIEADNGRQALSHLSGDHPVDLVICDLVMPEQEGLETIMMVRNRYPDLKVIAISGAFGGGLLTAATHFGACATIAKPIQRSALLAAVQEALGSKALPQSDAGSTAAS